MDNICSKDEGWGPQSRLRQFDFTPCFEDTILFAVPETIFVISALATLKKLSERREIPYRKSLFLTLKTVRTSGNSRNMTIYHCHRYYHGYLC
jgi:hypothetical protein